MNAIKRTEPEKLVHWAIAIVVAVGIAPRSAPADTHYVNSTGSFAPAANDTVWSWSVVGAAACATDVGDVVEIEAGNYREFSRFASPARLQTAGGLVRIGDVPVQSVTTFNVLSFNTHLFGDIIVAAPFGGTWQDYNRAEDMADYFTSRHAEIDFIGLCEIWDEDLFLGGDGAEGILPSTPYLSGAVGTAIENQAGTCLAVPQITTLHSGLAMMGKQDLTNVGQVAWNDCDGSCPWGDSPDCLANKGWLVATVEKDGFILRVVMLHMQAGNNNDQVVARWSEINQLAGAISAYRSANPSHVVIVMGDFNVFGENLIDYGFFSAVMMNHGGHDAARNAADACFDPGDTTPHQTYSSENGLAVHFDSEALSARLDYVVYFASLDGSVRVTPDSYKVEHIRGRDLSEGGFSSIEKSDHYAVEAHFSLWRP